MASLLKSIPISTIHAYHSRERRLFSRMVLDLHMDTTQSMKIIAFWLWLEEWEGHDVIDHLNCFDDSNLQIVAFVGRDFVNALCIETPSDQLCVGFHQNAVHGIKYYLQSVCLKAFNDIRRKADEAANLCQMKILVRQLSSTFLQSVHGGQMIPSCPPGMDSMETMRQLSVQPYVPHGEGTSNKISGNFQPLSILDVERGVQFGYPFNLSMFKHMRLIPPYPQIGYELPIMAQNIYSEMGLRSQCPMRAEIQQQNIPIEERTLFVTFSKGHPLTEKELFTFFMR